MARLRPTDFQIFSRAERDPQLLERFTYDSLRLDPAQTIAFVEGGGEFRRQRLVEEAHKEQGVTRLYENVDRIRDSWLDICARQLAGQARCPVTASVYESTAGVPSLVPHTDAWEGLILQIAGQKVWTLHDAVGTRTELLDAGDVAYVPTSQTHSVATPERSVHVVFEFITPEAEAWA